PGSKHPKDLEYAAKAVEHLKIYTEAYPADRKARGFLVSLYLSTERYDEAIAFYQQLVQENPKDVKAMQSLAQMYFKKGDVDNALQWLGQRVGAAADSPATGGG